MKTFSYQNRTERNLAWHDIKRGQPISLAFDKSKAKDASYLFECLEEIDKASGALQWNLRKKAKYGFLSLRLMRLFQIYYLAKSQNMRGFVEQLASEEMRIGFK
ncbi:MAG: hypothetical protein ACRCV9_02250 [Burkholderiaceae bacterium]